YAGAAISVAAAAAALTARCLMTMVPLLYQGEGSVAVKVPRALSAGAGRMWSGGSVASENQKFGNSGSGPNTKKNRNSGPDLNPRYFLGSFFSSSSARGLRVSSSLDFGMRST